MADTAAPHTPHTPQDPHGCTTPAHLLAQARVRSLSARPVGPLKVVRAQEAPTRHQ